MKRRFVQIDGELVEVTPGYSAAPRADYHVMPDIEPFKANDGAEIKGRAHWREHLKATGALEMGHADVASAQAAHERKREAHRERLQNASRIAAEAPHANVLTDHSGRSSIAVNVLNRLHGRPMPDRKTIIKIGLEEARRRR